MTASATDSGSGDKLINNLTQSLDRLFDFLRFPSVSAPTPPTQPIVSTRRNG